MERKRKLLPSCGDGREDGDRRTTLRKRSGLTYAETDFGHEEESRDDEEEDGEQPGMFSSHDHIALKDRMNVTCGEKRGILDLEKLKKREWECIQCSGTWLTPTCFEKLGGKIQCKKWKTSILYMTKPLEYWFKEFKFTPPSFKKRVVETSKEAVVLSPDSEAQTEEDDLVDEDGPRGSEQLEQETEEESPEAAKDGGAEVSRRDSSKQGEGRREEDMSAAKNQELLLRNISVVLRKLPDAGGEQRRPSKVEHSSKDSQSLQPDEAQAEKEHNSEPSHGLEDCPNTYEASPAEARNEELCLEFNSEGFAGESHSNTATQTQHTFSVKRENVSSIQCTDDPAMESHQSSDATQPQPAEQDERTSQAGPSSDATQTSNTTLPSPASPQMFSGCDLDMMDLGQLKREKLKMQINVLTLQKEYFTQKLEALKKKSS
ncbi:uncharacterized protein LOC142886671 [Nelusetta ayraudi]|uniref:uncharacterized protein LOC142886671 n=1 Tax=Nelusetta ayraudi TaxID=303726 RepID=UPI003F7044FD